jgi:hypothetical protein
MGVIHRLNILIDTTWGGGKEANYYVKCSKVKRLRDREACTFKDTSWKLCPQLHGQRDFLVSVSCGPWVWLQSTPKQPTPGVFTKGFPNKHCLLISPYKEAEWSMFVYVTCSPGIQ